MRFLSDVGNLAEITILDKSGNSLEGSSTITGWPGASEYSLESEGMGFNANGILTSQGWGLNKQPMTDGEVIMHRTITFIPPD